MKTKVIFRTFHKGGDVLAIFPEEPHDRRGDFCMSYQHVGQHGSCDPFIGRYHDTRPATPEEIAPLKRELESLGYVLDVRKRVTDAMHTARRKAASETLATIHP